MTTAADELEAIRQLKARYCRFLDTKDIEAWRAVFTTDVVVSLDMAVSTGGTDYAATMHQRHTPEITLTSATTATGIWAMEDWIVFGDGHEFHGADHYHETYEKRDGNWQIKTLHSTRTILRLSGDDG
jgi:SnoaL-like protein